MQIDDECMSDYSDRADTASTDFSSSGSSHFSNYIDRETGQFRKELVPLAERVPGSLTWWEREQLLTEEDGYDSDKEGSRPVRQEWPQDSLLSMDHFTIDKQHCLKCRKHLPYALPMNKNANPKYLFCCEEDGTPLCALQADYIQCWACGNLNSQTTAHVVTRPANCAYLQPSQIYDFMCHHCHKDMMEQEPGVEECKEQLKKIKEMRRLDKQLGGGAAAPVFNSMQSLNSQFQQQPSPSSSITQSVSNYISSSSAPSSKKRKLLEETTAAETCSEKDPLPGEVTMDTE